jgi:hypothetical protein
VHGRATGIHGLTIFTTIWTWGSHHLPPYSIIYAWPQGLHPNVILPWDSQVESLKIPKITTPATFHVNLQLR